MRGWIVAVIVESILGEYAENAIYAVELVVELVTYVVGAWTAWAYVGAEYSMSSRTG